MIRTFLPDIVEDISLFTLPYNWNSFDLKQEIRAFREDGDYSGDEKQKIVLKSLILLTYSKKFFMKR